MKISGSIGIQVLEKNINNNLKKILIFSDAHSGIPYCENNYISITNWLKKKLNGNYQILLEEVKRKSIILKELWPTSPHIQELKKLYLTGEENIIPIDIRPYLIPFSWELIDIDNKLGKILLKDYISKLNKLFNNDLNYFNFIIKSLIKKKLSKSSILGDHFNKLSSNLKKINKENKNLLDKDLNYVIVNNRNSLININNLLDLIMEWYIIVNIFSTEKVSIIHTGLYHSEKIIKLLINNYNFKSIYNYGTNNVKDTNNNITSCVYFPKKLNKYFGFV
jgi:hypothetical protein